MAAHADWWPGWAMAGGNDGLSRLPMAHVAAFVAPGRVSHAETPEAIEVRELSGCMAESSDYGLAFHRTVSYAGHVLLQSGRMPLPG